MSMRLNRCCVVGAIVASICLWASIGKARPYIFQMHRQTSPLSVSYCELVKNPYKYDGHIVRVTASMMLEPAGFFMYDLRCASKDAWTWPELAKSYECEDSVWGVVKEGDTRVRRTVVGRFEAPNGTGYGHMNAFRQQIVIQRDELIERVDRDQLLPSDLEVPAPLIEAETAVTKLDERWVTAASDADLTSLDSILAREYVLLDPYGLVAHKNDVLADPQSFRLPHLKGAQKQEELHKEIIFSISRKVFVFDDSAIVALECGAHDSLKDYPLYNNPFESFQYTNTYKKRDGGWQLVLTRIARKSY